MKKNIKLITLLTLFALVFSGCEEKKEWSLFYGFTNEDIIGSYSYSNIDDAFDNLLESQWCHLCPDAKVNIMPGSGSLVRFRLESESADFSRTVEDFSTQEGNDFMIMMEENPYEVSAYVYKDAKDHLRLHGFVRKHVGGSNVNYYFDVIKDND